MLVRQHTMRHQSRLATVTSHGSERMNIFLQGHAGISRLSRIQSIYRKFQGLDPQSIEYQELADSGTCFAEFFNPFRDFRPEHDRFLRESQTDLSQFQSHVLPYRVKPETIAKISHTSCLLEGNSMQESEVMELLDPVTHLPKPDAPNSSPPFEARSMSEVNEVYFHLVALHHALELSYSRPPVPSSQLQISLSFIQTIHSALMKPFEGVRPGRTRQYPIKVTNFPLAVFPYPREIPALLNDLCEWTNREVSAHPILFACDLFLNFALIHPFQDGNGRLGRIMGAVALASRGFPPVIFLNVPRAEYLDAVYQAQQMGDRSQFYALVVRCLEQERTIMARAEQ